MIRLAFTLRFIVYTLSILPTAALLLTVLAYPPAIDIAAVPLAVFAGFTVLGTRDLIQTRHTVLRNYPISAHLRFLLEQIRPEMRQYFFEDEKDGSPFSRDKRAVAISAPRWCWTSLRSGRSTTSMRKDWPHLGRGDAPRIPQKSESQGSRHKNAISRSQESCECDSELALLFSLSSAFAILSIFAATANGCLQKGDLHRSVLRRRIQAFRGVALNQNSDNGRQYFFQHWR